VRALVAAFLRGGAGRALATTLGAAVTVALILFLNGLLAGLQQQVSAYLKSAPGELIVSEQGVKNLLGANSLLPSGTEAEAEAVPGVGRVAPLISQVIFLDLHQRKLAAYLIAYDPGKGGGPWVLSRGEQPSRDDEIVVDAVLAKKHALDVGSSIEAAGRRFRIAGLSSGTASWMASFVFARKSAVEKIALGAELTGYLLVTAAPGTRIEVLRERLRSLPGTSVWLKGEVIENDLAVFSRLFGRPVALMAGVSFAVGVLIVALTTYRATLERRREIGVLKAIGVTPSLLYVSVALQAFMVSLGGTLVGVLLAWLLTRLLPAIRPDLLVVLGWSSIATVATVGIATAILSAIFPVRLLARIPPAEVFRR
jgi:putative ABC transport system permease protein